MGRTFSVSRKGPQVHSRSFASVNATRFCVCVYVSVCYVCVVCVCAGEGVLCTERTRGANNYLPARRDNTRRGGRARLRHAHTAYDPTSQVRLAANPPIPALGRAVLLLGDATNGCSMARMGPRARALIILRRASNTTRARAPVPLNIRHRRRWPRWWRRWCSRHREHPDANVIELCGGRHGGRRWRREVTV